MKKIIMLIVATIALAGCQKKKNQLQSLRAP